MKTLVLYGTRKGCTRKGCTRKCAALLREPPAGNGQAGDSQAPEQSRQPAGRAS